MIAAALISDFFLFLDSMYKLFYLHPYICMITDVTHSHRT